VRSSFNRVLKSFLLRNHVRLSRANGGPRLMRLLEDLRPVETEHELIRIGGDGDGGYLIPNDLRGIDACFSPGVSTVADFEVDLVERSIPCFMADYSVEGPPVTHPLFDFEKKFLGSTNDSVFTRLDSWMLRKGPEFNDLILQMDIEGAEYEVLLGIDVGFLRKFRILVVEFHSLEAVFDWMGFELIKATFDRLLMDFAVVHIHPNNCLPVVRCDGVEVPPVMEFTFLRKDRIAQRASRSDFPHRLDRKCVRDLPDVLLPRCWY
jgi:hypothetical protein